MRPEIPESYKYCSEVLKYLGFAFLSPLGTILFSVVSNTHDLIKLDMETLLHPLLIALLGLKFIERGFNILNGYYCQGH